MRIPEKNDPSCAQTNEKWRCDLKAIERPGLRCCQSFTQQGERLLQHFLAMATNTAESGIGDYCWWSGFCSTLVFRKDQSIFAVEGFLSRGADLWAHLRTDGLPEWSVSSKWQHFTASYSPTEGCEMTEGPFCTGCNCN